MTKEEDSKKQKIKSNDNLSERVKRLSEKAQEQASEMGAKSTETKNSLTENINDLKENIDSVADNLRYFRSVSESFFTVLKRLKLGFLSPLFKALAPPIRFLLRSHKKLWNKFVYVQSADSSEPQLSKKRATFFSTLTFLAVAMFTPTSLGNAIRFFTVEPIIDGSLMLVSKTTEEFFLNHSEEILPEENIHSVRGCRRQGKCREIDAAYFRIKPRLSHDIWKLINHGDPLYIPDHVVAPIAPGVNRCEVTYYGYRLTSSWISRLMKSMQIYPVMLEADCTYVGAQISELESTKKEAP